MKRLSFDTPTVPGLALVYLAGGLPTAWRALRNCGASMSSTSTS
jgi:hypothetical protein